MAFARRRYYDIEQSQACGTPTPSSGRLAHVDADATRKAYARTEFWDERVRMMAWWAERCEEMRRGGVVVPLRACDGVA